MLVDVRGGVCCRADERLIGELFVVDTRGRTLKRPAVVQLSHRSVNRAVESVGVLWRPNGSTFWQSVECSPVWLPPPGRLCFHPCLPVNNITKKLPIKSFMKFYVTECLDIIWDQSTIF